MEPGEDELAYSKRRTAERRREKRRAEEDTQQPKLARRAAPTAAPDKPFVFDYKKFKAGLEESKARMAGRRMRAPLVYPPIATADDVHRGICYRRVGAKEHDQSLLMICTPQRADGWMTQEGPKGRADVLIIKSLDDLRGEYQICLSHSVPPPEKGDQDWVCSKSSDDMTKTWAEYKAECAARVANGVHIPGVGTFANPNALAMLRQVGALGRDRRHL